MERKEKLLRTQALGATTFTFDHGPYTEHQIVVQVSATPATGTLAVTAKAPGLTDYFAITGTMDLTGGSATVAVAKHIQDCPAVALTITPTNFEVGPTYDVFVTSWNEGLK